VGAQEKGQWDMYAIETSALNKRFRQVRAVCDVSLRVEEGAVYALMGPNGAGKTTLIKLLMNLMSPTDGRISMLGRDVCHMEGKGLETVGYVSENQRLPDWMTAAMFLAYCRPFYPAWDKGLEERLVKRFELPLKRPLKRLSRGMRMKAALASTLAFRPRLIVLDEPLSGLDPLVRDDLMESLREMKGETTVLLSSHDLAEIESFSSHVGYMDGGRLLLSEPMAEVGARFRRVEALGATLAEHAARPAEWLHFEMSGNTARWVEAEFDGDRSAARARAVLGAAELKATPITLREIFLAMARKERAGEPGGDAR
jgi:ABC-2 type transport system ATP-binding protein